MEIISDTVEYEYPEEYDIVYEYHMYARTHHCQFESLGTAPELQSGDASGDGKTDIVDAIMINKAILGKETLTSRQRKAADLNGDGKPDASDSLTLMKYIVGLIETL